MGFTQPVKTMIAYTHLMEFLPERENIVSGLFMFFDGLVIVVTPPLFIWVSQDLDLLLLLAFVLNVFSLLVFVVVRVPESLPFLLLKGEFETLRREID